MQNKIWVLSSALMYQGLIHNPNLAPIGYPMKIWGSFGKVACILSTAQQNFLIGQYAKMNMSHWLRHPWQYLNQDPLSPDNISTIYTS